MAAPDAREAPLPRPSIAARVRAAVERGILAAMMTVAVVVLERRLRGVLERRPS